MTDWVHREENRKFKCFMFAGLGAFMSLPIIHMIYKEYNFKIDIFRTLTLSL
jgi:hypothetical protein